ncbi:hypothetical protein GS682_15095 [Nostoc sp. B(2019)]|nr:hypothetical protein [Nostoc sp. B(2019)]
MLNLLVLINWASFVALIFGVINPKLVLLGEKRTRLKSAGIYLGLFVTSGFAIGVLFPKSANQAPEIRADAPPQSTPIASPSPTEAKRSLTPILKPEVTPAPTQQKSVIFNSSVCSTGAYLPIKGASTALYTVCQYINTNSIKSESVALVTGKNAENDELVLELQAEAGFERFMWRDYNPLADKSKDVCIEYVDKSVSCFKFSKEPDEVSSRLQIKTQQLLPQQKHNLQRNLIL